MRIFLLILCTLAFVPASVAQEGQAPVSAQDQIDQLLGKEKEETPTPQTLDEFALAEFQQCMKTEHPILQGRALSEMCACAKEKYADAIDLKGAQDMYAKNKDGRFQHYRMLMFAYSPCVKDTVARMLMNDCRSNRKNKYLMQNLNATCSCIATRVSDAMDQLAPKLIEGDIAHKRYFRNPLDVLIKPDAFNRYMRHSSPQCVDIHERRTR